MTSISLAKLTSFRRLRGGAGQYLVQHTAREPGELFNPEHGHQGRCDIGRACGTGVIPRLHHWPEPHERDMSIVYPMAAVIGALVADHPERHYLVDNVTAPPRVETQ